MSNYTNSENKSLKSIWCNLPFQNTRNNPTEETIATQINASEPHAARCTQTYVTYTQTPRTHRFLVVVDVIQTVKPV
jgi:hypothetical protein